MYNFARIRGDSNPESDFQLFGDSGSGFGTSKSQTHDSYRGVMILALYLDLESNFHPFGDFRIRIRIQ